MFADDAEPTPFHVNPRAEIPLRVGWNALDLAFDGSEYHVLGQRNEIHTAHSNETFTFVDPQFNTVFFEPGQLLPRKLEFPATHANDVSTAQGADYQLTSVRLLVDTSARSSFVVVAMRERGHTYVDARPVTLELFRFRRNGPDFQNGDPVSAFVLVAAYATRRCYHDSNDALVNELGLSRAAADERPMGVDRSAPCTSP
ncbi:MAG TPA: hypothetical protein VMF03_20785 [Steroidobacteraceae bacterium]|nr:hypothetical protein [Steroidobacteraceae bacterium]